MDTLAMTHYSLHYSANFPTPNAPTVLFIHDMMVNAAEWIPMTGYLGNQLNFVVYDLYDHERTGGNHRPSFKKFISDICLLINHLKLNNIHIVGDGLGGNIGFEFARRYPQRVASLTMMATNFFFKNDVVSRELTLLAQLIDCDRSLFFQKLLEVNFQTLTEDKILLFENSSAHVSSRFIKECLSMLLNFYDPERFCFEIELSKLNVPTLVLHGTNDLFFPGYLSAIFSACLPNSHFLTVPGAAHNLPLDQPEITATFVSHFILTNRKSPFVSSLHNKLVNEFREVLRKSLDLSKNDRHILRITMMGEIQILWNDELIEGKWNQRRAKELLLFIILKGGMTTRDELIQTFLPSLTHESSRNHLRVQINHLNQLFHDSPNPDVHNLLLINEQMIALNAQCESDIGDYQKSLDQLAQDTRPINDQLLTLILLLKQYDPDSFTSFHGEWINTLTNQIESKLSDVMVHLLSKLNVEKMYSEMRGLLHYGKSVEPYDGYCEEQLMKIQHHLRLE
ncbi:alpha/beta fold hydrolase [Sporolactobacillus kofuensis]|uniref:Alpha/beta fold hydrolase n=1 Tax=Sporolactobacillus kofuensis TaxID=269672 RepID=A0ABW1WDX9_9BACL|nr:alpha/beta hydrolase [Sporolactobacillus kofuensis]MCO7176719.1 alpha/beta hydrolase [Sporolactobacillus kofuensis]